MTKREQREIDLDLYHVYAGILFANQDFSTGENTRLQFDFTCKEYGELINKYSLQEIAGEGSEFTRALKLCRYLAPRLKHKGDYCGDVAQNALTLLDYAFEKEEGINCVCKAKILQECCLALGIYVRRVGMYPLSPYDVDNHVVCEIYDRQLQKWIFLDPTTGGYFSDGDNPLGILEVREKVMRMQPVSVILDRQNPKDLQKLQTKNSADNSYYAKNLAFFSVDEISTFGAKGESLWLVPTGFCAEERFYANMEYRMKTFRELQAQSLAEKMEAQLKEMKKEKMKRISLAAFVAPPSV